MNNIAEVKRKPDDSVIKYLTMCLEEAKAGKLQEFVLVGRYEGGDVLTSSAGHAEDAYKMFGMLMDIALEYRDRNIQ